MSYRGRNFESRSGGEYKHYGERESLSHSSNITGRRGRSAPYPYEQGRGRNSNDRYSVQNEPVARDYSPPTQHDDVRSRKETYYSNSGMIRTSNYSEQPSYDRSYHNRSDYASPSSQGYDNPPDHSFSRGGYADSTSSRSYQQGGDPYSGTSSFSRSHSAVRPQPDPVSYNSSNMANYHESTSNSMHERNPFGRRYGKPGEYFDNSASRDYRNDNPTHESTSNSSYERNPFQRRYDKSGEYSDNTASREYRNDNPTHHENYTRDVSRAGKFLSHPRPIPQEERTTSGYYKHPHGEFSENLSTGNRINPREIVPRSGNLGDIRSQSGNASSSSIGPPSNKKFQGGKKPQTRKQMNSQRQKKRGRKAKKIAKRAMKQLQNQAQADEPPKGNFIIKDNEENDDGFLAEEFEKKIQQVKFEKITTREEQIAHVRTRFTPLWNMPYLEQVKLKHEAGKKLVTKICNMMSNKNGYVNNFLQKQKELNNGLPCKIHDIMFDDINYNYYKNTLRLVVGLDNLTGKPCAGLPCGVAECCTLEDDLPSVPKSILPHIRAFESFLNQSQFPCQLKTRGEEEKCWKIVTFRTAVNTNEIMMLVGFKVVQYDDPDIQKAKEELKSFFGGKEGEGITSLWLHIVRLRDRNGPSNHYMHLSGRRYIEEIVNGIKFQITPHTGFPHSLYGAQATYEIVKKLGRLNKDSVIIDVSSPAAFVSFCLTKDVQKAVFLKTKVVHNEQNSVEKALSEVTSDSEITNWTQHLGKVETSLPTAIKKNEITKETDAVVFIDPYSRLRSPGVAAIKEAKEINRILFCTYGRKLMLENFNNLADGTGDSPENIFVPVEAVALDAFPHCTQVAVFVLLERMKIAKARLAQ